MLLKPNHLFLLLVSLFRYLWAMLCELTVNATVSTHCYLARFLYNPFLPSCMSLVVQSFFSIHNLGLLSVHSRPLFTLVEMMNTTTAHGP